MVDYNYTWWQVLNEFNIYSIVFRLLLAMLFGGIIGMERGSKRRAAGFRTYMLVCIASALIMLTNQYISIYFGGSDPARLGAQVISGIGFLGAGTIIVTSHNQVKGLTTAAGLWASAGFGLTVGIGFYEGALAAGILIFLVITVLQNIDAKLASRSRNMEVYVELKDEGRLSDVISFSMKNSIQVLHIEFTKSKFNSEKEPLTALLSLRLPKKHQHSDVINEFMKLEAVYFVEEI